MHAWGRWGGWVLAVMGGTVGCGGVGGDEAEVAPPPGEERASSGDDDVLAARAQALDETHLQLVFDATADAHVAQATPDTRAGTSTRLYSDGSPMEWSYLRFAVQGLNAKVAEGWRVSKMYLRLYATAGTDTGFYVYEGPGGWSESTLTWNTRPQLSGGGYHSDEYRSFQRTVAAETYVDAPAAPEGGGVVDGTYNYILSPIGIGGCCTSTDGTSFVSRDSSQTAKRPRLVLELTRENTPPPPPATSATFRPVEDAHVAEASPTSSYPRTATLEVDSGPAVRSFLRFDVTGVATPVKRATLRLHVTNGSADGPVVYGTQSWSGPLTWNTQPPRDGTAALTDLAAVSSGTWVEVDVTRLVQGPGAVSLGLWPSSTDGADFASVDHPDASLRPQLVVVSESSGGQVLAANAYDRGIDANGPVAHHAGTGDVLLGWTHGAELRLERRTAGNQLAWERRWTVTPLSPQGGTDGEAASGVVYGLAFAPDGSAWALLKWRWGTVDLGSGPLSQGDYLVKLSASGQVTFVRGLRQGGNAISVAALDVDGTGYVAVAGSYRGEVDFGAGPVTGPYGAEHDAGFVARYTPAGALRWVRSFGNTESAMAFAVDTGPSGEVLVGGTARGQDRTTFGGVVVSSQYDAFGGEGVLARLGADGTVQWAKGVGQALHHVAFSRLGTAVALGVGDYVTWAGQETQGPPTFLITAEPNGAERWIRRADGTAYGLGVDDAGSARVLIKYGDFTGAPSPAGRPLALVRINLDGNHRWTNWLSPLKEDPEFAVQPHLALQPDGQALVFGAYSGTATFGGFTLQATDAQDSALLRVAP